MEARQSVSPLRASPFEMQNESVPFRCLERYAFCNALYWRLPPQSSQNFARWTVPPQKGQVIIPAAAPAAAPTGSMTLGWACW